MSRVRKILGWVLLAYVVYAIVKSPTQAADVVAHVVRDPRRGRPLDLRLLRLADRPGSGPARDAAASRPEPAALPPRGGAGRRRRPAALGRHRRASVYTFAGLFVVMWVDARIRVDGGAIARAALAALVRPPGLDACSRSPSGGMTGSSRPTSASCSTTACSHQKVAMMPLIKVTDMSYQRSVPGRIFGYGRFVLESAGQDQALRQVDWVPHPDVTYRILCTEIFGVPSRERVTDPDRDDGYLDDGTGAPAVAPAPPVVSPLAGAVVQAGRTKWTGRIGYAAGRVRGGRALVVLAGHPASPVRGLIADPERRGHLQQRRGTAPAPGGRHGSDPPDPSGAAPGRRRLGLRAP